MPDMQATHRVPSAEQRVPSPAPEELAALTPFERRAFRVAHRMNHGRAKRVWTWVQRTLGAWWIQAATSRILRVYGLEHLEATTPERPLLLVANHRSFFDMYAVSSTIFRRARRPVGALYFPVRGRFFYQSPLGMVVNLLGGWWAMYPPFFRRGETRAFDAYALRLLTALCQGAAGPGTIVGFHPEGTRNKGPDPYAFLPAQPGVGKLIKDAGPALQVLPVFVLGLGNGVGDQLARNWRPNAEPVRIRFGAPVDCSAFYALPDQGRTYRAIAEQVMEAVKDLGEEDRREFAK
jgi:1-acyl-sn-glycerol-3-phosphate acyltransferase